MELDELKTSWQELDRRLDGVETKTDRIAMGVAAGKFTSAKRWLRCRLRMSIVLLVILPVLLEQIFRLTSEMPGVALLVVIGLFFVAMLVRQVVLLELLARIDPLQLSVRDACAAVLRFRCWFLIGVVAGVALAVPLVILLGVYMARMTTPYVLYGFGVGLAIGLPLGVRIFLRTMREINTLKRSLEN